MLERNGSRRVLLGASALGASVVSIAVFAVSAQPAFRALGVITAAALVLGWFAFSTRKAQSRQRHPEQYPEALKHYAIGEVVIASAGFERVCGAAIGMVELNGEQWKARCVGNSVPTAKQRLIVVRRKGLTLDVQPQEDAA